jgi:beta-fructofuranosidase
MYRKECKERVLGNVAIIAGITAFWLLAMSFSSAAVEIPEIDGEYVRIYKPQPDVFTGNDTAHYKKGETYINWQPNDHTFLNGPEGRWHCLGITRPCDTEDDGIHEGEGLCFHAVAPVGPLKDAMQPESWMDKPKFDVAGSGWAPHGIKINNTYSLISSNKGRASSKDLFDWKDEGKLEIKSGDRDPNIMYWEGTHYLVRCNHRSVNLVTSKDFVKWTEPVDIFVAPEEGWRCESPTLLRHNGMFYLFWCLWDSSGKSEIPPAMYEGHEPDIYDYRTYVYASDDPRDFNGKQPIAELKAHAPEIFQDEKGNWFISSADYPQRGINLAPLLWKSEDKSAPGSSDSRTPASSK